MIKLTAYFDESGTDGRSPIVAVGGYISTNELWNEFQNEWNQFLSNNDIEVFHSTDLQSGYRAFTKEKGWSKKRAESAMRIADKLISKYVLYGVIAYTTVVDCEKVFQLKDAKGKRKKFSAEYLNSGIMVTNLITRWAEENGYTEPIEFVFEDGVNGKGYLMQALDCAKKQGKDRTHLISSVSFASKKEFPQLHAVDRLVNLGCRSINSFLKDENSVDNEKIRKLLVELKLGNVHAMDSKNFPILAESLGLDVAEIYEKEN